MSDSASDSTSESPIKSVKEPVAQVVTEPTPAEIEVFYSPRSRSWQGLFETKGWLKEGKIVLPPDILVYLYFPPATTDINTIESINLQRVTEVTEHFIIHRVNANEEEYYLWEDIQCLRIKTKKKKPARFGL